MTETATPSHLGHGAPRTFDDIVGQTNAVEGLRKRVRTGHKTTGTILYGPAGVGKRTLARLYAKAVLCERPTEAGSFCDRCVNCRLYDEGRSADVVVVDAKQEESAAWALDLLKATRDTPWSDRRVITIVNADASPQEAFDKLLPTLERARTPTTFILLACNLKEVRLAGQSRCELYRLNPLAPDVAKKLVTDRFHGAGIACDEHVLDVLVAAGKGLPRRLGVVCSQVVSTGDLTLRAVRKALDLDWAEETATYWHAMLTAELKTTDVLAPWPDRAAEEQVRRVRVFLNYLYLHGVRHLPLSRVAADPALLHQDASMLAELAEAFKQYAGARGISGEQLWCELARHWLSDDRVERANLFVAP